MSIVPSHIAGKAFIDALQLEQKYIKRIEIIADAQELAFCTVEFYLDESQVDAIADAFRLVRKSYALAELNDENVTQCPD